MALLTIQIVTKHILSAIVFDKHPFSDMSLDEQ